MIRLLFLASLFLDALCIHAADINAMMLHLASGKQIMCMLDERPVVTFRDDQLVLTTHMSVVSYQASDVLKFTYVDSESAGINNTEMPKTVVAFTGNSLCVSGLAPDSQVAVYSVDGKLIASAQADRKCTATLDLPGQAGKVYVVKTSIANFKITKP